jgi:hypothetical protein
MPRLRADLKNKLILVKKSVDKHPSKAYTHK